MLHFLDPDRKLRLFVFADGGKWVMTVWPDDLIPDTSKKRKPIKKQKQNEGKKDR